MKAEIHPDYVLATVTCSCGNSFQTRSTKPELHVEICADCHPFYTGKQKLVDTGGRVERFQRRLEKAGGARGAGPEGTVCPTRPRKARCRERRQVPAGPRAARRAPTPARGASDDSR